MPFVSMMGLELPDDATTIWRYMDLWKFESIVDTSGLYFVRADRFTDSWDSVLSLKWRANMQREIPGRPGGVSCTWAEWYEEREIPSNPIHCWNCDAAESDRMWHEYTSAPDALVIQSTVGRLKQCFSSTTKEVRIGRVKYGDHDDLDDPKFFVVYRCGDAPPEALNPWYVSRYFKKVEFTFENEIRASMHTDQPIDPGYSFVVGSIGLQTVIESIRLHPSATTDFATRVESLLSKYGLGGITVERSSL